MRRAQRPRVMQSRSYQPITPEDLDRLSRIAAADRADLFERKQGTARLYADRLFAVALCQGGALHFIDGKNGVKDLAARCGRRLACSATSHPTAVPYTQ